MAEFRESSLDEILLHVARRREPITILLEDGDAVEIRPIEGLTPLPELEGHVPAGWKDAIYDR